MSTNDKRRELYDSVSFEADARVPFRDKLCMGLTAVSTNGPWVIFGYFLMYFYTDVLGMSGVVAGSLMAFARTFDAITDLIMGWAIDHFNLKWGKYRSWVLFSIPAQFILFVMIFIALPDTTSTLQMIIACIGYGCFGAIGSTLCFPMAVDYGQWKFGHNQAGFIFACYGFCLTIGGSWGSALLGILLDGIGYSANTVLSELTLRNLLIVGVALPALLTLVQVVIQAFLGMDDKLHDQYVREVAEREVHLIPACHDSACFDAGERP